MGGIGFIILVIVIVSIYRSMTRAAKEANEKAIKKAVEQSPKVIEDTHEAITPKPTTVRQTESNRIKAPEKWNEQEEATPEIKLDSIEEVRRAVIYSEIINRKY